ncbi:MAG: hypothetical protein QM770_11890 [Tepidisphaeraceae bacterium]
MIDEFSSHRLLWERVERELTADPFAPRGTVSDYLSRLEKAHGIEASTLPVDLVVRKLIEPLLARRVAIELQNRGVPIALYGSGWNDIDGMPRDAWRGPIRSRLEWDLALRASRAILDVWPATKAHRCRFVGRPVIQTWSAGAANVERTCRRLELTGVASSKSQVTLSLELIRRLID